MLSVLTACGSNPSANAGATQTVTAQGNNTSQSK
jgi:hypothetical protein